MKIAVIPARGGSKRIPRKNIKPFAGKPMIGYAIEAAKSSGLFDHVVVSTDDADIAAVSREFGAETPFVRPAQLANDHTPTVPVISHAIESCEALGWRIKAACCIYPGVPLIQAEDMRQAWAMLESGSQSYVYPVTEFPVPVQQALKRNDAGLMQSLYPQYELTRTQDLERTYYDVGQFYWGWRDAWFDNPRILSSGLGLPIPQWRVVDIDTLDDWIRAELLYKAIHA